MTADGLWYLCLYATAGTDLRARIRSGASPDELRSAIAAVWRGRADRGAQVRLLRDNGAPLFPAAELRRDPHLEMHTRGGVAITSPRSGIPRARVRPWTSVCILRER